MNHTLMFLMSFVLLLLAFNALFMHIMLLIFVLNALIALTHKPRS